MHAEPLGRTCDVTLLGDGHKSEKSAQFDHTCRVSHFILRCIGHHNPAPDILGKALNEGIADNEPRACSATKRISPSSNLLEFLEWVAAHPRTYSGTMDAWRTSCPRLHVWEDAVHGGLVERVSVGQKTLVQLTGAGRDLLAGERP